LSTRRLLRNGGRLPLAQAFDPLLAGRQSIAGDVEDDLLKLLWPSTFVVDTNLAGLVVEVRRALATRLTTRGSCER
jgi:hypothetical protein